MSYGRWTRLLGSYDVHRSGRRRLAAAVAIATGALAGCSSTQTTPLPPPVATAIPSTFPLAAGTSNPAARISLQRGAGIDPGLSPWIETTLSECGRHLTWVSADTPVAAVMVPVAREHPSDDRTLAAFPSVAAATAQLSAIATLLTRCAVAPVPVSPHAGLGDASYAWITPHSTVLHVAIRVGSAIVVERTTQTTATPAQSIASAELRLRPVIAAMCGYAERPCAAASAR